MVDRVVKQYDDGRMDIVATGRRRFEIVLLNEEKDYLRGAVQFFDDDESGPPSPEAVAKVQAGFDELKRLDPEDSDEPPTAALFSFQVAQSVPDLNFRQLLLATRSEAERIKRLADYLPGLLSKLRLVAHVRAVAPTNGHSAHTGL
jgi:Lon protease-like protein